MNEGTQLAGPATPDDLQPNAEEEILSTEYLETAEEAAALTAKLAALAAEQAEEQSDQKPSRSHKSSYKSKRNRVNVMPADPEKAKKHARAHRQARLIIYGGMVLLVLIVVVVGTYKGPMFMHKFGWIDSPQIWPWTKLLPLEKKKEEPIPTYTLKDGTVVDGLQIQEKLKEANKMIRQADGMVYKAEQAGTDSQFKNAADIASEAMQLLDKAIATLENYEGLKGVHAATTRADKLMGEIAVKAKRWREQIE